MITNHHQTVYFCVIIFPQILLISCCWISSSSVNGFSTSSLTQTTRPKTTTHLYHHYEQKQNADMIASNIVLNRRQVFARIATVGFITTNTVFDLMIDGNNDDSNGNINNAIANANDDDDVKKYDYENRNRNSNKNALIRDDYWYLTNTSPPRKLSVGGLASSFDDPKWNSFGSCETSNDSGGSSSSNSCTYVSLKQRIPAYSKYAFNIQLGVREYGQIGKYLKGGKIDDARSLLRDLPTGVPCYTEDALLKALLLATGLLTSPNYAGPPLQLLVARYYINEVYYATNQIKNALFSDDNNKNIQDAIGAWEFGKDSWNSYINLVNRSIVPKVGDKFELIDG